MTSFYEPNLWYFPLLHFLDESGGEIKPCTSNLGADIDAFLYVDCEGFNDSSTGVSFFLFIIFQNRSMAYVIYSNICSTLKLGKFKCEPIANKSQTKTNQ